MTRPAILALLTLAVLLHTSSLAASTKPPRWDDRHEVSGWRISCREDKIAAAEICTAWRYGLTSAGAVQQVGVGFVVYLTSRGFDGPIMVTGNTYPGRNPLFRVDEQHPTEDVVAVVEQMQQGKLLRWRFHVWPTGPEDAEVPLAGFAEAYEALRGVVKRLQEVQR